MNHTGSVVYQAIRAGQPLIRAGLCRFQPGNSSKPSAPWHGGYRALDPPDRSLGALV